MPKNDVDFPFVKQNADIVAVLAHYNVSLSGDGVQRRGNCPFHDDKRPSLSVNVEENLFNCKGCGVKGNVISLVQQLDSELSNPRRAAQQIAKLSGIPAKPNGKTVSGLQSKLENSADNGIKSSELIDAKPGRKAEEEANDKSDGIPYNKPLTFQLQLEAVEPDGDGVPNEFVEAYGLPYKRLADLGIGMGQRGVMKNRLAIPIFNRSDELVAYCGRDVGLLGDGEEPKYKFPPNFRKELELYGWNVAQHFDLVVLVESFLSVIKHGGEASRYGDTGFGVAALMGTSVSDQQIELLLGSCSHVIVCFDGDDTGWGMAPKVAERVAKAGLWVSVRNCGDGQKPHQVDSNMFCQSYGNCL